MQIIYTRHARQRMAQRKVTAAEVRETFESPDEIIPGSNGDEIAIKRFGPRDVRVVYEEVADNVFIVYTVMKSRARD